MKPLFLKSLAFTKMHALGNDFMVLDGVNQIVNLTPSILQQWSDRHRGIGFDQCLLIEKSQSVEADFFYSIFNADGSEVGQCGNGARCVARFIHEQKLSLKKILTLATRTTRLTVQIHDDAYQKITAALSVPRFLNSDAIMLPDMAGKNIVFHAVDLGNPHAVIQVDDVTTAPVNEIGKFFNAHPFFLEGVNVGFMQIENNQQLKLRVFERGAGETEACGSGACAAMVCARKFYDGNKVMSVELPGGTLDISWENEASPVSVTGNAVRVFEGVIS